MPKFDIRFVRKEPIWVYAEVEADTLDDALDLLEDNPEKYIYEVDPTFDQAPGLADDDFDFAEYMTTDKDWKSVN